MDSSGKLKMSRELLERLTAHQPNRPDAYGGQPVGSAPFARARRKNYRESMLGTQPNIRRMGAEMGPAADEASSGDASSSSKPGPRIDSGQNRPSAGFKEPPGRGYNPFG